MKILLKNNVQGQLSIDLFVDKQTPKVRVVIPIGGTVDVGSQISVEDLARSQQLQEMVADGDVTITLEAETSDNVTGLASATVFSAVQLVAATAVIGMGIAAKSGTIVAASVAAVDIGGAGESMTVDILKNGVSILTAPIVWDSTSTARTAIAGALDAAQVQVATGDFLEASLTYVAGAPTPITNTIIALEILPA